ncbi:acyl-CoA dehydrogenase [Actinomadura sp. CNU-125]|uniref:acyl-CoA dehydrogenase family protein n=1 Tax=Actinomadura sp. CNU-125 TaxID=1904961 RepID=UPI0009590D7E|nr:acyl-CoA dehydrogenase family protein [Actinomadura sp. CNU-125]OLT36351.1 acyl-CoA dehydrogenase [Actinomadura sp. CNU-125]
MIETTDHQRLRQQVRDFADAEVAPRVADMETCATADTALPALIARQGWIGVTIPADYGGMAGGHFAKTIIIEELSRVSGTAGAIAQASQLGVAKILHFGTEEQKQRWLPPIASGDCLPTIAVTEEGSGGHVLGMRTTAARDGDHYVLNGRKQYVGNSHVGHVHGVVACTGGDGAKANRELSAFLVEADRPGVRLIPHQRTMGLRGFSFGDIVFEDVRVPATHRLGAEGDGLDVAYSSSILYGRPNLAAVALGILRAAVEETVSFSKQRHRYGRPLSQHPVIMHKIGALEQRLNTARTLVYQAVHRLDHGQPCDRELINSKYHAVEAAIDSTRDAVRIHGAAGLRTNRPVERLYRDAICTDAPAGTRDIQLYRLAEAALGVDRPQWSARFARSTALHPPTEDGTVLSA